MPDYWIKISETEDEDLKHHHYMITAADEKEAKKFAMKFMERFVDDDDNPGKIPDGFTFYNNAVVVRLKSINETSKERFKEFLLKTHTIDMVEPKEKSPGKNAK
jgi:hypothetical protein